MLTALLSFSVGLNLFCLGWGVRTIAQRGGRAYLMTRLAALRRRSSQAPSYGSPIYDRRSSLLEHLPIYAQDTVVLGDSITNEGEWSELWSGFSIKNRGIAGDTTLGLLNRLDPILHAQPQRILLMIGINDLLNDHRSPAQISANHEKILTQIQAQSPHTTVLVQSVLPVNAVLCGRRMDAEIMAINTQLRALAQTFAYEYVDLFTPFADAQQQLDVQYTLDGVHLNGPGYRRWQQLLDPYLLE